MGSLLAPLLIGIALGDLLHGLPINSAQNFTGSFWDLFQPYAVLTGVTLVLICLLHGATFLSLKTTGSMHERSGLLARRVAPFTAAAVLAFAIWTHVASSSTFFLRPLELLAILAVLAAAWLVYEHRDGFAFAATAVTMASCIVSIFVGLYPNVMVSSTNPAYNLTVHNTASAPYSLKAMTVVVVIFLPLVLAYQTWTYYVFRRRVSREQFMQGAAPAVPPAPVPAQRRARAGVPATAAPRRPAAAPVREEPDMAESYDVIVIGTGAGGGTLARHLAPSGKRILLLERGDWLPREPSNWSTLDVFVDGRYISADSWYSAEDKSFFQPQVHYFVGGATKLYGAALYRMREQDFGELRHHDGLSPAWPISYQDMEPYYTAAEESLSGARGAGGGSRRSRRPARPTRTPRSRMSRASSSSPMTWRSWATIRSTHRAGSWSTRPTCPTAPA